MGKINRNELQAMLKDGRSQAYAARHFRVSEAAVCKAIKRMKAGELPSSLGKLTGKQRVFALNMAEGRNATESAMVAYDCKSREVAKALGSRMAKEPDVNLAIQDLMAQEGIPKRRRVQRLRDMIECRDLAIAGRGLDIGFRLAGDYAPQQVEVITAQEIRALIASIPLSPVEEEGEPKG